MKARRARRPAGAGDAGGMSEEDRKAVKDYRANRGTRRYFRDLAAIDTAPASKPGDKENSN